MSEGHYRLGHPVECPPPRSGPDPDCLTANGERDAPRLRAFNGWRRHAHPVGERRGPHPVAVPLAAARTAGAVLRRADPFGDRQRATLLRPAWRLPGAPTPPRYAGVSDNRYLPAPGWWDKGRPTGARGRRLCPEGTTRAPAVAGSDGMRCLLRYPPRPSAPRRRGTAWRARDLRRCVPAPGPRPLPAPACEPAWRQPPTRPQAGPCGVGQLQASPGRAC